MRRAFRKSLSATPLVLEIVPPARSASEKEIAALVDRVRDSVRTLGKLDGLILPQVLFEAEPMATVLRAYGKRCAALGLKPATVLLSFAPVSDYQDLEFLAWLGASVTPRTEEALVTNAEGAPGRSSIEIARTLWSHLHAAAAVSRPAVPLGVNVEEVTLHNFDLAVQIAREFPAWRAAKSPPAAHV